jgi:3,5-epimerase/4-reductase
MRDFVLQFGPMKLLLFGARGYLGTRFRERFPDAAVPETDIADQAAVRSVLESIKPDAVINCAGKTGKPNVDWCEDHKEETIRANVTGPLILLDECLQRGIHFTHVSSGCIFAGDNGGKGFSEEDTPNFSGSFYSRSKAWSDQVLREFPVLILRLRMPFDGTTSERNLIMKLRKYARVLDEPNSITHLPDFLDAAERLLQKKATGVYNVVNPGSVSPYQVMELYREIVDPAHAFERLTVERLREVTKAGRSNCILSTEKLRKEGIVLPDVRDALRSALGKIRAT